MICTDKTGTLTQNRMSVRSVYLGGRIAEAGAVQDPGSVRDYRPFFEVAALCHELPAAGHLGEQTGRNGDPMERALFDFACRALGAPPRAPRHRPDPRRRRPGCHHR